MREHMKNSCAWGEGNDGWIEGTDLLASRKKPPVRQVMYQEVNS